MRSFFTKYYYFDQNNENKMDVARSTNEGMRNGQKEDLIGKHKENNRTGSSRH
jgi:hypothetical protein